MVRGAPVERLPAKFDSLVAAVSFIRVPDMLYYGYHIYEV